MSTQVRPQIRNSRPLNCTERRLLRRVTKPGQRIGAMFARRLLGRHGTARHPPASEPAESRMNRHSLTLKNPIRHQGCGLLIHSFARTGASETLQVRARTHQLRPSRALVRNRLRPEVGPVSTISMGTVPAGIWSRVSQVIWRAARNRIVTWGGWRRSQPRCWHTIVMTASDLFWVDDRRKQWSHTLFAEPTLQHRDLMAQGEDLHVLVAVPHRQQP